MNEDIKRELKATFKAWVYAMGVIALISMIYLLLQYIIYGYIKW